MLIRVVNWSKWEKVGGMQIIIVFSNCKGWTNSG